MMPKLEWYRRRSTLALLLFLISCATERRSARVPQVEEAPPPQASAAVPPFSDWDLYLREFRIQTLSGLTLHADSNVPLRELQRVAELVTAARERVRLITGINAGPPAIYVHANAKKLAQRAGLDARRVVFYEAALHIAYIPEEQAPGRELLDGVNHEYVHYALQSRGIVGPSWLEEGLAMQASREQAHDVELHPPGLDLREMAEVSPHRAPSELAERFYAQAQRMLELLQELCGTEPGCNDRELVKARADGAPPDGFFEDVIAARAPSAQQPPQELWQSYLAGLRSDL